MSAQSGRAELHDVLCDILTNNVSRAAADRAENVLATRFSDDERFEDLELTLALFDESGGEGLVGPLELRRAARAALMLLDGTTVDTDLRSYEA